MFRENFPNLASGEMDNFQFSCDIPLNSTDTGDIKWDFLPYSIQDATDFVSNNPIASIYLIEADASTPLQNIATDDGAIMVSGLTANNWTISTINTPNNGSQPFSGNRQWGWIINQSGNFEFYTRAVDVATISKLLGVISFGSADTECQQETYYDIADATWRNMQQEIENWVVENGGQAQIAHSKSVQVQKEILLELLTDEQQINSIPCN